MAQAAAAGSLAAALLLAATAASASSHDQLPPSIVLGEGWMGRYGWAVVMSGPTRREAVGPHRRQRPCMQALTAEMERNEIAVGGAGVCYGVPGYLEARSEPLIVEGERGNNGGKPAITVIGMAFAPAATKLEMTLADGRRETIHLRQLNPRQARKVRLRRLRYAAFAVRGYWCAQRLVSLNATGQRLWESGEYTSCSGLIPN